MGKRTPRPAPRAMISSMTVSTKARSPGSANSRSRVAPLTTDSGLEDPLPTSLDQTSSRMDGCTCVGSPPASNSAASAVARGLRLPSSSPRVRRPSPACRIQPGSTTSAPRCTTAPSTWPAGRDCQRRPPGSTPSIGPAWGPLTPWNSHQGSPLTSGTTVVRGEISGAAATRAPGTSWALTVSSSRSQGGSRPRPAPRSTTGTFRRSSSSPTHKRRPCIPIAATVGPRPTRLTSAPARARRHATTPPMAPAPNTTIRCDINAGPQSSLIPSVLMTRSKRWPSSFISTAMVLGELVNMVRPRAS